MRGVPSTTSISNSQDLNAVTMGMTDYGNVDPETYEPVEEGSWANQLIATCEIPFLVIFTLELVVKTVAMGFKQYWKDNWNR